MAIRFIQVFFIASFTIVASVSSVGQVPVNLSSDSLLTLLKTHPSPDTSRVLLLNQLAFVNYYSNPLTTLKFGFEARRIADSLQYTKGEADAFRQIGLAFWAQADIPTAIKYFLTGLKIAEVNHHAQVAADITRNIVTAYNGLRHP